MSMMIDDERGNVSACTRFKIEVNPCQEWFSAVDAAATSVAGEDVLLDIRATFCPRGEEDSNGSCYNRKWIVLLWKTLFPAFMVFFLIYNLMESPNPEFYPAYITNVTLIVTMIYSIFSAVNSFFPVPAQQQQQDAGAMVVPFRIKLTWALFVVASHASVVVTIFYWPVVWDVDDGISFLVVVPHGITMILSLIDGLFVNRIPIRIHHWMGLAAPYDLLYVIWTILHAVLDIGNPNVDIEGVASEDEFIYAALNWSEKPVTAIIYSVAVVLVLGPVCFWFQWYFGNNKRCGGGASRLRYLESKSSTTLKDPEDQMMAKPY